MSPRILQVARCPHCKQALEAPPPRVCPACGGSIQKRFLSAGCLTSAPPPVLALALGLVALRASCAAPTRPDVAGLVADEASARHEQHARERQRAAAELVAMPARRP